MNTDDINADRKFESARVECYSGYKVNERPAAFTFQGRRWEISEILDRWYEGGMNPDEPIINYFKVKADDGNVFILRYTAASDEWAVLNTGRPLSKPGDF